MKKFIVTATSRYGGVPSTFTVRAWNQKDAEHRAREQGLCLASDTLETREAKKDSEGYIE